MLGSNPAGITIFRIGVTAARLTLTQEVVVQIHDSEPYGPHTTVVCRSPKPVIVVQIHRPVPKTPVGLVVSTCFLSKTVRVRIPVRASLIQSPVVQMANTPDCLSGDRGFESRRGCHLVPSSNRLGRQPLKLVMLGSNPAGITRYARVAELEDASGSSPDAQQGLRVRSPPRVPYAGRFRAAPEPVQKTVGSRRAVGIDTSVLRHYTE